MSTHIRLGQADRYALVGKTGSGKTTAARVLASVLVPWHSATANGHQVWWLDTKSDPKDLRELTTWGYVPAGMRDEKRKGVAHTHIYWRIVPREGLDVVEQAQAICALAMRRRRVILVADEYTQLVPSKLNAGRALDDVHARGRGLGVGLIGLTQEPVQIPRKLISQCAHLFLFDLTYRLDQKYAQEMCAAYVRPPDRARAEGRPAEGDRHGFFHSWVDGDADWRYYRNIGAWFSLLSNTPSSRASGKDTTG